MGYLPIAGRNSHRISQLLRPKSHFSSAKFRAEEAIVEEAVEWKKTFLEVIEIERVTCIGLIVVKTLELNRQGQVIL